MTGTWTTPGAHLLLPHDAPREVWLAERAKGIGGSDAAAVAGFNGWTSPREVYWDKRGLLKPKLESEAMFWGKQLEDAIAGGFEVKTGIRTRRCGLLRSKTHPFMQVSVDRLTADGGGLEIKNMGHFRADEWGDDDDPLIPDAAEIQAMHCMAVTGKPFWWVMGLLGGNRPVIRKVLRVQKTIDALIALEHNFWHNNVLAAIPPPVDGSDACTNILKTFYRADPESTHVVDKDVLVALLNRKVAADAAVAAAQAELDLVKNEVRDLAGTFTALTYPGNDGRLPDPVFTLDANGKFSTKVFRDDDAAAAARYTREVTEVRLDVEAIKTDDPELYARYRGRVLRVGRGGKALLKAAADRAAADTTTPEQEVA